MAKPVQLIGETQLKKLLRQLPDKVHRKVTRQAVTKASTPIVKAARAKAPKESGTLKKSMGRKVVVNKKTRSVTAIIGPRRDVVGEFNGETRVPANYAHLVEDGHLNSDGSHTPPSPFLRPAFDEQQPAALSTMKSAMAAGVVAEAKKLGNA